MQEHFYLKVQFFNSFVNLLCADIVGPCPLDNNNISLKTFVVSKSEHVNPKGF